MLRTALVASLVLPLVACIEPPTSQLHRTEWSLDPAIRSCTSVTVRVYFAEHVTDLGEFGCTAGHRDFVWMSDDPPESIEVTALDQWEEDCEGLSSLWCTTRTVVDYVGHVSAEPDLVLGTTVLVVTPS